MNPYAQPPSLVELNDISQKHQELLALNFSCKNLINLDVMSLTDSFLVVHLQQGDRPQRVALKTPIYNDNLNPEYAEALKIEFIFEEQCILTLEVYHQAQPPVLVGKAKTSVGEVYSYQMRGLTKELVDNKGKKTGEITVKCERVSGAQGKKIQFKLHATDFRKPPCSILAWVLRIKLGLFYRVYRKRPRDEILVYQSEVVQNCKNALFNSCEVCQFDLNNNDPDSSFEIRFFHNAAVGRHDYLGKVELKVKEIVEGKQNVVFNNKTQVGIFRFGFVKMTTFNTFNNYLASGLQMMLINAIDFTQSNKYPDDPKSLHYIEEKKRSLYEEALEQVSRILLDFDYDKLVPVYGFGARRLLSGKVEQSGVSHFFPLNGNFQNPNVYQVQGIMSVYRQALQKLRFGSPTFFHPVIEYAIGEARRVQRQKNKYIILLILTDGEIHDMDKVIDQIVECCSLPISLIIAGLGKGPFDAMEVLNDNELKLVDSKGRKTTRDLVQFVEFEKFRGNGHELARQVLLELPRQVEEYYAMMGIGVDEIPND